MQRPNIRLVAIDLDGTLLNDSKEVSEQTVGALRCLAAQEIRVVIASARPPRAVRHIYQQLALDSVQINCNGALIWDEGERRPLFHRPIDGGLALEMIRFGRGRWPDLLVSCEVLDRWLTDRFDDKYATQTAKLFRPDVIGPLEAVCAAPLTKLMFLGEPGVMDELEKLLRERYSDRAWIVRQDPDLLQLAHHEVSKAEALKCVARHYGIEMGNVMAIGDAPNDLEMIEAAGVGVAMDNAHPIVKAAADWVAPSNNDHGVHGALVRYGLC